MDIENAMKVAYLTTEYQRYKEGFEHIKRISTTGDRNIGSIAYWMHRYFDEEADKYHEILHDALKQMFESKISEIKNALNNY